MLKGCPPGTLEHYLNPPPLGDPTDCCYYNKECQCEPVEGCEPCEQVVQGQQFRVFDKCKWRIINACPPGSEPRGVPRGPRPPIDGPPTPPIGGGCGTERCRPPGNKPKFSPNALGDATDRLQHWQNRIQQSVPGTHDGPGALNLANGNLVVQ